MRLLTFLLIAGVILSIAKAVTPILILLVLALIIWAVVTKPLEVFGFMALGLLTGALQARPTTTILCIAGIALLVALKNPASKKTANSEGATDMLNGSVTLLP